MPMRQTEPFPRFISFEGIDGAGKSSHVQWMSSYLKEQGHTVVTVREPGGTPLGEKLRTLLLTDSMSDTTELLLMFAARKQLLTEVIEPALDQGHLVLSDRFHDSSYAFQGGGRHIGYARIFALDQWVGGRRPDLTFYFDVDTAIAARRMEGTRTLDRFESEERQFHHDVREMYLNLAAQHPERIIVIDGEQRIEEIRLSLQKHLELCEEGFRRARYYTGPVQR